MVPEKDTCRAIENTDRKGKGLFTLGGILAGYRGARYRAEIRCVYTRRETGGKTVGVMQMSNRLFT